jgi:hypothetical protein
MADGPNQIADVGRWPTVIDGAVPRNRAQILTTVDNRTVEIKRGDWVA